MKTILQHSIKILYNIAQNLACPSFVKKYADQSNYNVYMQTGNWELKLPHMYVSWKIMNMTVTPFNNGRQSQKKNNLQAKTKSIQSILHKEIIPFRNGRLAAKYCDIHALYNKILKFNLL